MEKEEWEHRQQEKLDRLIVQRNKAKEESQARSDAAHEIMDYIPLGQPVLVGHYSQARHERDLDRIHTNISKAVDLRKKAEYYQQRIEAMERGETIINSDDPDAITKLEEKLSHLQALRELWKEENKIARKNKQPVLHAGYEFQNMGSRIQQVKKRLENIKSDREVQKEEIELNGITLHVNTYENRIQLHFPGKPPYEVRQRLKSLGWRWSPKNMVWQKKISKYGVEEAKELLKEFSEVIN